MEFQTTPSIAPTFLPHKREVCDIDIMYVLCDETELDRNNMAGVTCQSRDANLS